MPFLYKPLLGEGVDDFLLFKLLHNVIAGLFVASDNLRARVGFDLLFGHILDGVPHLRVGFLDNAGIFEVLRSLHHNLLEYIGV